jgi:hypothetical protein
MAEREWKEWWGGADDRNVKGWNVEGSAEKGPTAQNSHAMTVLIIVSVDSVRCGLQLSFHRSYMLFLIEMSIIPITAAFYTFLLYLFLSVLSYYCSVLMLALIGLM